MHESAVTPVPPRPGPAVSITAIRLYNGVEIPLQPKGVTVVVGGNNSGKSTLLRQALSYISQGSQSLNGDEFKLVESVDIARRGADIAAIEAWLASRPEVRIRRDDPAFADISNGMQRIHLAGLAAQWGEEGEMGPLHQLTSFFVHASLPLDRAGMVGGVQIRNTPQDAAVHPLHHLEDDRTFLSRLNDIVRRVFRQTLTLDDSSLNIQLRLGEPDVDPPRVNEGKAAWRASLAHLPPLSGQGDGMKSLIGLLLPIITASASLVIVDEPEVFLHPPQAYALGQEIGRLTQEQGLQVVLATHDKGLLAGLLNSNVEMSVVRINRGPDGTAAHSLPAARVATLWDDPILRFSNVLDGLFHRGVVIAEADRDCRFFAAALERHSEEGGSQDHLAASDVLFVPSYGKQGALRIVEVLRSVSIPVVSALDLDILRTQGELRRLVEAHGGAWGEIENDYRLAVAPLNQSREPATLEHVRAAILSILDPLITLDSDARMNAEVKRDLGLAMRARRDPWQEVKAHGIDAFQGQSRGAVLRLLGSLERIGIAPVKDGELESLARDVESSKGPQWLREAIETNAHAERPAQDQIARILSSLMVVSA